MTSADATATVQEQPLWRVQLQRPAGGWLNANERLHWATTARRTKVLRRLACVRARKHGVPELQAAHVVLVFHHGDRRRRDVANLAPSAKAIIDGLVDAHLLPDDDDTRLVGPTLRTGDPAAAPYVDVLVFKVPASAAPLVSALAGDLPSMAAPDAPAGAR